MRHARAALGLALVAAAGLAAPHAASAHARSTSTSSWDLRSGPHPGARVQMRVRFLDLQRVLPALMGLPPDAARSDPEAAAAVERYLTSRAVLLQDGRPCPVTGPVLPVPSPDATHVGRAWRVECEGSGPARLRIDPFFEVLPGHLHLARLRQPDGGVVERVFVLESPIHALAEPGGHGGAESASGVLAYLRLGVEHIATGTDHLVFLLALLLVGVSALEVITIVTGFTVAHSVTLALGVLGVVEPKAAAVESLIGLSIAVVALENFALTAGAGTKRLVAGAVGGGAVAAAAGALAGYVAVPASALLGVGLFAVCYLALGARSSRPRRLRWFVAFVFGLVHGFGFAGLLTEIGLPRERLFQALLGFNLGVEAGQIAIVLVAWPVLRWLLARDGARQAFWVQAGSTPVLVAGLYWFLTRALA